MIQKKNREEEEEDHDDHDDDFSTIIFVDANQDVIRGCVTFISESCSLHEAGEGVMNKLRETRTICRPTYGCAFTHTHVRPNVSRKHVHASLTRYL